MRNTRVWARGYLLISNPPAFKNSTILNAFLMIQLPGNGCETLTRDGKPVLDIVFPEVGCKVKARISKVTFTQAHLQVFEVEGRRTFIEYKAILKASEFNPSECLCDKYKKEDVLDCIVVSYSESGISVLLQ